MLLKCIARKVKCFKQSKQLAEPFCLWEDEVCPGSGHLVHHDHERLGFQEDESQHDVSPLKE